MFKTISRTLFLAALAWSGAAQCQTQQAQPGDSSKTVVFVVPFAAGSGTDQITRILTSKMGERMGKAIVVENKPGANGQIGSLNVARAQPDGHTLLVATVSTHAANRYLFKELQYDPIKDFSPIGRITLNPLALLVRADSAFNSVGDLIEFARKNPGKLSYGHSNAGSQVSTAMLLHKSEVEALAVPYKSTPQTFTDLVAGRIDFAISDFSPARALVQAEKLKVLAVTSLNRFHMIPDVPAVSETKGMEDYSFHAWLGLMAPAGTPPDIVSMLNAELRVALEDPAIRSQLEQNTGSIIEPTTVDEFVAFMHDQDQLWRTQVKLAGIQPE